MLPPLLLLLLVPLLPLVPELLLRGFSRSEVPDQLVPKPLQAPGHADCGVWQTLFTQRCELTTEWLVQSQYTTRQSEGAWHASPGALPFGLTVDVGLPPPTVVVPPVPIVLLVPLEPEEEREPAPPSPPVPTVDPPEHAKSAALIRVVAVMKPREPALRALRALRAVRALKAVARVFTIVSMSKEGARRAPAAALSTARAMARRVRVIGET